MANLFPITVPDTATGKMGCNELNVNWASIKLMSDCLCELIENHGATQSYKQFFDVINNGQSAFTVTANGGLLPTDSTQVSVSFNGVVIYEDYTKGVGVMPVWWSLSGSVITLIDSGGNPIAMGAPGLTQILEVQFFYKTMYTDLLSCV